MKAPASLCIVTNSTELKNSRNSKFPYYFSFQRSAKAQTSLCILVMHLPLKFEKKQIFIIFSSDSISEITEETVHWHKLD